MGDGTRARSSPRRSRKDLLAGLARPPLSDRRFWVVQAAVAAVFLARLGTRFATDRAAISSVPGSVWILLLLVPIVYAGRIFGFVGSAGAALSGVGLFAPEELLAHHSATGIWEVLSALGMLLVTAVLLGDGFEERRLLREQLCLQERRRAELERGAIQAGAGEPVARSERRFQLAFENNTAGMAIADLEGRLVDVNRAYCEMLGYEAKELLGRNLVVFTHPDDRSLTLETNRRITSGEVDQTAYVKRYLHKDGRVVYGDVLTGVMKDEDGRPMHLVASIKDVSKERELAAQLSHQALHDPLTGLANRVLFDDRLTQALARGAREGGLVAVLLLDLDDFKGVNDSYGHHVGDQLLVALARRFEQVTRKSDTLSRFGGDEFLYLAAGLSSPAEAEEVARRLLDALSEPVLIAGTRLEQRASIGVVVGGSSGREGRELVQNADTALYEAKRQGKARHVVFSSAMHELASNRFELLRELRQAFASGELSMHYQPLVDLGTGAVAGFEALMRWEHPTRGWVPPGEFIPLAEQSGLISELGTFALGEAGAAATSWRPTAGGACLPYVSVNLSACQFHDPDLVPAVESVLASTGLPPRRLVLEITESVALADPEASKRVIEHFERLGVHVALDDFGTGYSSLSYLTLLRPSIIKIDHSFVGSASESIYNYTMLEAIVSLGHKLNMTMVAEGVETPEQLERLRHLGCDLGQGYLFSPAVPSGEVARVLDSTSGSFGQQVASLASRHERSA